MELCQCAWNAFFSLHFSSEHLQQPVRDIKSREEKAESKSLPHWDTVYRISIPTFYHPSHMPHAGYRQGILL